ncbi:hypothetical protein MPTK1_6g03470 [Marchantia polymorpha subsp. ruderalis]|uniref:Uncharacterized protein n=2 Tax=Marchantia polymorpha TaxID=3197 RepID=A0AAF6BN53_MARPO|nr:hypothetical protein MARPO_0035s0127 [Marchantia polymorpha]BBN13437.1 hypothetical protein Mp_6g03470 [Marchantia polymorpha subsp. ruderalis]|eukprot:PTQ41358.1 hypothetical protein MARPO_0035s0127 [Marchantia polymorpha]
MCSLSKDQKEMLPSEQLCPPSFRSLTTNGSWLSRHKTKFHGPRYTILIKYVAAYPDEGTGHPVSRSQTMTASQPTSQWRTSHPRMGSYFSELKQRIYPKMLEGKRNNTDDVNGSSGGKRFLVFKPLKFQSVSCTTRARLIERS